MKRCPKSLIISARTHTTQRKRKLQGQAGKFSNILSQNKIKIEKTKKRNGDVAQGYSTWLACVWSPGFSLQCPPMHTNRMINTKFRMGVTSWGRWNERMRNSQVCTIYRKRFQYFSCNVSSQVFLSCFTSIYSFLLSNNILKIIKEWNKVTHIYTHIHTYMCTYIESKYQ